LPKSANISLYCCSPHIIPGTYAEHPGGTLSKLPSSDIPFKHIPRNMRPPIAVHVLPISLAWNTPGGPLKPFSPGIPFKATKKIKMSTWMNHAKMSVPVLQSSLGSHSDRDFHAHLGSQEFQGDPWVPSVLGILPGRRLQRLLAPPEQVRDNPSVSQGSQINESSPVDLT
jgi:hypothetical protein